MSEGKARDARRFAAHLDWSGTPIGSPEEWPTALQVAWDLALACPLPMALFVGDDHVLLYNDAFAEQLGDRHPQAFGRSATEVVPEVWDESHIGGLFDATMAHGQPFLDEGTEVRTSGERGDDTPILGHFLRTGSPVHDEEGRVIALLHIAVETSSTLDRARAVTGLATALSVAVTVDDVCKVVLRESVSAFGALSVGICLPSPGPGRWRMARRHRIEDLSPDEERLPLIWAELPEDLTEVVHRSLDQDEPHVSDGAELVAIPLRARSTNAVVLVFRESTPLPRDVVAVLSAFTDLVGEALGRAVVYDAERSTAELLQRTLLPPSLPQSDEISIAARYEPVSEGTVAGGDFYDSFFLPDGRLALVIGDVVGRGVMAATVMGQVRAAVRGAALTDPHPETVMASLDRVVWDLDALWPASMPLGSTRARPGMAFGGELFVTMLYGTVSPQTGVVELASAGHPLPALLSGRAARDDGRPRARLLDMTVGPPLGLSGSRPTRSLSLEVGDMLVVYTDGLIERRDETLDAGEARLLDVLADVPPSSPRSVAQLIMESMVPESGQEDDCAVLTVGRSPAGHHRAAVVVPPMPESVKAARDWAREQMELWTVSEADQYTIITGISELITNAVLHAGTESHLTLDLDTGVVAVTVADSGNRGEPLLTGGEAMAVRGRGLSLVRAVSDAFGAHRTSAGTTVWFEVEVTLSRADVPVP